jgi:hypothetical protein
MATSSSDSPNKGPFRFRSSGSTDPGDPRNAHKEQGVMPSNDPLTLGLQEGSYVIGDGRPQHHPCIHALAIRQTEQRVTRGWWPLAIIPARRLRTV